MMEYCVANITILKDSPQFWLPYVTLWYHDNNIVILLQYHLIPYYILHVLYIVLNTNMSQAKYSDSALTICYKEIGYTNCIVTDEMSSHSIWPTKLVMESCYVTVK